MEDKTKTIEQFVADRNEAKLLFTAGPAALLPENLTGLRPCFGRGDRDYTELEEVVLRALKGMSGHRHIARMQGSASLALEVMALNFLYGRVLVISTGYYSNRLRWLAESAGRRTGAVKEVMSVAWDELDSAPLRADWIFACFTETSCGLKIPVESLSSLSKRLGARLMLDATASIGLESGHENADVIAYSSCKGLFGLTGASFIAFNEPASVAVDSFYLNIETHLEKRMTGPYHAIASLLNILPRHESFRTAVIENKKKFVGKMSVYLTVPGPNQPLLCTHVSCKIVSDDPRAVMYEPRSGSRGSVVCHLGEVSLKERAHGRILDFLRVIEN